MEIIELVRTFGTMGFLIWLAYYLVVTTTKVLENLSLSLKELTEVLRSVSNTVNENNDGIHQLKSDLDKIKYLVERMNGKMQ